MALWEPKNIWDTCVSVWHLSKWPLSGLLIRGLDIEHRLLDCDITTVSPWLHKSDHCMTFVWSAMVAGEHQSCAEWVCTSTWSYLQQSPTPQQIPLGLVYLCGRLPILYLPRASDIYGLVSHPISLCCTTLLSALSVATSLPQSVCSPNLLPWLL